LATEALVSTPRQLSRGSVLSTWRVGSARRRTEADSRRLYTARQERLELTAEAARLHQLVELATLARESDQPAHMAPALARGFARMLERAADDAEAAGAHRFGLRREPLAGDVEPAAASERELASPPMTQEAFDRRRLEQLEAARTWTKQHGEGT
jgi:hypothetical protein